MVHCTSKTKASFEGRLIVGAIFFAFLAGGLQIDGRVNYACKARKRLKSCSVSFGLEAHAAMSPLVLRHRGMMRCLVPFQKCLDSWYEQGKHVVIDRISALSVSLILPDVPEVWLQSSRSVRWFFGSDCSYRHGGMNVCRDK